MPYKGRRLVTWPVNCGVFDPADSSSYMLGSLSGLAPTTSADVGFLAPFQGQVIGARLIWKANTAVGTSETFYTYVNLNNATDYQIAGAGNANAVKEFSNMALGINFNKYDELYIKIITPAWATNPTGVYIGGEIYVSLGHT